MNNRNENDESEYESDMWPLATTLIVMSICVAAVVITIVIRTT